MKKDDREYLVLENCSRKYSAVLIPAPGAPLTYFSDGGVRRIFLGLTFRPKGIFLGL